MISGDSTASHMGSVKNIEKARERRTFETMPGSTEAGMPDELLAHAESVHPRMGYDMSDSIFMQEMQAAGRKKESQKALEERTALEAFRAAALQKPFAPSAATSAESSHLSAERASAAAAGEKRKSSAPLPPPPLAGIKLRRKTSCSEALSSPQGMGDKNSGDNAVSVEPTPASSRKGKKHSASMKEQGEGDGGDGEEEEMDAEEAEGRRRRGAGGGAADGKRHEGDGVTRNDVNKSRSSHKKSKKKRKAKSKHSGSTSSSARRSSSADSPASVKGDDLVGGDAVESVAGGGPGGGLGLVAYSSGEESDS